MNTSTTRNSVATHETKDRITPGSKSSLLYDKEYSTNISPEAKCKRRVKITAKTEKIFLSLWLGKSKISPLNKYFGLHKFPSSSIIHVFSNLKHTPWGFDSIQFSVKLPQIPMENSV